MCLTKYPSPVMVSSHYYPPVNSDPGLGLLALSREAGCGEEERKRGIGHT